MFSASGISAGAAPASHESGYSHVPSKGPAHEGVRQRLEREEKERQEYLSHLTDADIGDEEDSAAARRKAILAARVAEAKKLEGHRTAAVATRGIEYVSTALTLPVSPCVCMCVCVCVYMTLPDCV